MNFFTTLYNQSFPEHLLKLASCSSFFCQKHFETFHVFSDDKTAADLRGRVLARGNIHIASLQNQIINVPLFMPRYAMIAASALRDGPFCHIDSDCLLWDATIPKSFETDLLFFSQETYLAPHKIGLMALSDPSIKSVLDEASGDFNFPIFNFGVFGCRRQEIISQYRNELSILLQNFPKLESFIKESPTYLAPISRILFDVLFSKLVHTNGYSYTLLYPEFNPIAFSLPTSDKDVHIASHLSSYKNLEQGIKYTDELYAAILAANDNCTIAHFINAFLDQDNLPDRVCWARGLKDQFIRETNSGGCTSCKMRRAKNRYKEIASQRFFSL